MENLSGKPTLSKAVMNLCGAMKPSQCKAQSSFYSLDPLCNNIERGFVCACDAGWWHLLQTAASECTVIQHLKGMFCWVKPNWMFTSNWFTNGGSSRTPRWSWTWRYISNLLIYTFLMVAGEPIFTFYLSAIWFYLVWNQNPDCYTHHHSQQPKSECWRTVCNIRWNANRYQITANQQY